MGQDIRLKPVNTLTIPKLIKLQAENFSSKPALISDNEVLSFADLDNLSTNIATHLIHLGILPGDRAAIWAPNMNEWVLAAIAIHKAGAVLVPINTRMKGKEAAYILNNSGAKFLFSVKTFLGTDYFELLENEDLPHLLHKITLDESEPKDLIQSFETIKEQALDVELPEVSETDMADIIFTSGTTGKPKGVLHGIGGYLTHLYSTYKWAFDIKDSDVYFCTADIGWVTGHSYVVYGPLLHGATQVMYEGAPDYPDSSRMWDIIQKYGVTIFYTTPTALRMLMKFGDDIPNSFDLSSLRLLGTVGEPINPQVWKWYFDVIGKKNCPIIDTWWQTETGGMLISPLPGIETIPLKPGSATLPIPGLDIQVVDESGNEVEPETKGSLIIKTPWPGMLLGLWKDEQKYKDVYWSKFPSVYYPGDYAIKDSDGYLWLLGRSDDVLKVAGHRIGTAELESSIVSHNDVAESAVCGIPDEVKGESIIAFVVLKESAQSSDEKLRTELRETIRTQIGPIATPSQFYIVNRLPKTRSGKIMRRLLKAIANNEKIGDVSTLEDGAAVSEIQSAFDELQKNVRNQQ